MRLGPLVCSICLAIGCSGTGESQGNPEAPAVGFVPLPSDLYRVHGTDLSSKGARLLYSFIQARTNDDSAPLFVVTAGGPGAPVLLLEEQLGMLPSIGHTLFIDARNSGFSYVVDDDSTSLATRESRLDVAEYNVFRDAADVAWVLLDFFEQHPNQAQSAVYFVAESYGGARTAVLLDLFLSASRHTGTDGPFFSEALSQRIEAHLAARFGEIPGPQQVAKAFRGQILLQPIIAGQIQDEEAGRLFEEPNSILDELAAASGTSYVRCTEKPSPCDRFANAHVFIESIGVSRYDYRSPVGWLESILGGAAETAGDPTRLAAALGISVSALVDAFDARPPTAFRFGEPVAYPKTALDETLAPVAAWDAYFVPLHPQTPFVFTGTAARELDAHPDSSELPGLFVSNLRYATTLITRAEYDLHVYSPALPFVLARLPGVAEVAQGSDPETIAVTLQDGAMRTIYAPHFAASHAVGHDEPERLIEAIATFLASQ